jgi:hypothetical protein
MRSAVPSRLGRMDVKFLHPTEHGGEQAQQDMLQIRLRDALVRSRVALMAEVPQECRVVIAPVVRALEELSQRIKELDASLAKLAAEAPSPAFARLRRIERSRQPAKDVPQVVTTP